MHAAVADQHQMPKPEPTLQLLNLRGDRARIAGVACEHLDGDRAAVPVAQQAIDDLRPIGPTIPAIAVLRELTVPPFQIRRAHIVEHQRAVSQVAPCQAPLDAPLLLAEPIQRRIDLAFLDGAEVEDAAQAGARRFRRQRPHGGQLGAGRDDPAGNHGQRQVALARRRAAEQPRQVELAHRAEHGGDMAVRQGALDLEYLARSCDRRAALQQHPQSINHRGWQWAQVGQGALLGLAPLAIAFAQQHRRRRSTIRHDVDEHGRTESRQVAPAQPLRMDTSSQPVAQKTEGNPGGSGQGQ